MSEQSSKLRELREKATPGDWVVRNPDDAASMNIFCITAGDAPEPDDENDLQNVVAVTLLQNGTLISSSDGLWEENAALIAYIPNMLDFEEAMARNALLREMLKRVGSTDENGLPKYNLPDEMYREIALSARR